MRIVFGRSFLRGRVRIALLRKGVSAGDGIFAALLTFRVIARAGERASDRNRGRVNGGSVARGEAAAAAEGCGAV
jgi:hypothetical protein